MTQVQTLYLKSVVEKSADGTFVLSAGSPDRVNDTIAPEAYDPYVGKKLIALWQHKYDQPVGYWSGLRRTGKRLIGDLRLAGTQLGSMIQQLLGADVPLGASIGFRGGGEPNKIGGFHFTEIELLEASIVSVPMHPAAVQLSKQYPQFLSPGPSSLAVEDISSAMSGQQFDSRTIQVIANAYRVLNSKP